MNPPASTIDKICPRSQLSAYIDGELLPREELELELHLAGCVKCTAELNEQKKMLCVLSVALEYEKEIELPANFTKVVVATAESSVSGLRRPQERFKALFICAALFLVVLIGLGSETETVFGSFWKLGEQVLAVGGFALHLIYDISIGVTVVMRSLTRHLVFGSSLPPVFLIGTLFVLLLAFSRFAARQNRA